MGELLERWFDAASPHWAPPTITQTRSVIRHHLDPHLGHLPVAKLTTADIDDLYGHLLRRGGADARPLSAGTVHRIHVVLHRALAQAVRWDWIWINPASTATPPTYRPGEIRPPSPGQVADLLASSAETDPALALFLRVAATTGARRDQLLALRWGDVDLEHGALSFTRALVEGPAGPVLAPPMTGRAYRVELDAVTLSALGRQRPEAPGRDDFDFAQSDGRPWRPNSITKRFLAARKGQAFRRSGCTTSGTSWPHRCSAAGIPIVTVSQRLSHARASTTLDLYAHVVPGGDREAADTLASLLDDRGRAQSRPERAPLGVAGHVTTSHPNEGLRPMKA